MRKQHDFSREQLFADIQEAEELASRIDTLDEGQEKMRMIYHWAEVVDGVAKMMVMAEEVLPTRDLLELQAVVNAQDNTRWDSYRRNIRWLNEPSEEI